MSGRVINPNDVSVTIIARTSAEGHPFSDVLYAFALDGEKRHACTRVPWPLVNTSHARAAEAQAFVSRQARA